MAQGLVEKIKRLDAPDPVARRDFIEEIRASCPDEDAWNEEYLCRPSSEQSALLGYGLIQACEEGSGEGSGFRVPGSGEEVTALPFLNPESRTLNPLYAGFDVGRKHDRSVLWVLERVGDVLWTRGLRVLENVNFTAQEQLLTAFLNNPAVRRLCIDSTGIGAMLAERLVQRFGHRVEAVHFTAPVKSDLAMPLLRLFQDRLVRIPADAAVREDLHKVRKIVTASNNVRLEADRDDKTGHADRFWALALACHAAGDVRERLPTPVMRKPLGW
jgi:phage FluMu gp28-like protein